MSDTFDEIFDAQGIKMPEVRTPVQGVVDTKEYAPEGGWQPEQFPQITTVLIPCTSNPSTAPDPRIYLLPDGWMFMEVGNVRVAIPNRGEWDKLVHMGECMWNTFEKNQAEAKLAAEDSQPWVPEQGELDELSSLLASSANGKEDSGDHKADNPR